VIERMAGGIFRKSDSGSGVCLGVAINEKCRLFDRCEAGG